MEFQQLKSYLMGEASFAEREWKELSAICEIRQGHYSSKMTAVSAEKVDVGDEHVRLFYERLKVFLLGHNKCSVAPLNVLMKSQPAQFRKVKKISASLYETAAKWNTEGRNHRNFCIGVYHLYVQLVVEYLQECKVPVSMKTVLQHSDKFEGLVDRAYPGYIKGDLMPLIIFGETPDYLTS